MLIPLFRLLFNPVIVNADYIPKVGAAVLAGNHKHALDPVLVDCCTKRTVHTLAKKELHNGKLGWFFRGIGSIPVDLKADKNKDALVSAIACLNKGALINVSPEAKRNYTAEILLPFKFGAVVMAKRTGSIIVPYSITGEYTFRSKDLKVVFGKPLDISELTAEDANGLLFCTIRQLIIDNKARGEE